MPPKGKPTRPPLQPTAGSSRPATVRIGAFTWAIKDWEARAADNSRAYGMCDKGTHTILIQEGMRPQKEAEVLLHEVFHAIYDVSGLGLMDNMPEEPIVNMLGYHMLQVIRDNPNLMAYLAACFPKKEPT